MIFQRKALLLVYSADGEKASLPLDYLIWKEILESALQESTQAKIIWDCTGRAHCFDISALLPPELATPLSATLRKGRRWSVLPGLHLEIPAMDPSLYANQVLAHFAGENLSLNEGLNHQAGEGDLFTFQPEADESQASE